MFRATWRNLTAHKLRLVLTAVAILVGASFVSGTLVFTDTLGQVFNQLVGENKADAVVRPSNLLGSQGAGGGAGGDAVVETLTLPTSVLAIVKAAPGVAQANPVVQLPGFSVIAKDGSVIGSQGPPKLGVSWDGANDTTPLNIAQGQGPTAAGQVALDETTFTKSGYKIGDLVKVVTPTGPTAMTLVGVVRFGVSGSLVGATLTVFDLASLQKYLPNGTGYTAISVRAVSGTSQGAAVAAIKGAGLPAGIEVLTGAALQDETASQFKQALGFINTFLLVFAFIALFVGSFIIVNTFSMLVAQRTRELALLRAVGASRRQVVRSVMIEALVVGLVAGLLAILGGIGVANLIRGLLSATGASLPLGSLVVAPRTLLVTVGLAVFVTLAAAYPPARRASRIPPVAALRDDAFIPERGLRLRLIGGGITVLLGVGVFGLRFVATGGAAAAAVGVAGLLVLIGTVALTPVIARPIIGFLGIGLRGSAVGRLASENARRNGRRTAATASALMIGLALVGAASTLASSITASTDSIVSDVIRADFIVTDSSFTPFAPDVAARLAKVPGVEAVSAITQVGALVGASRTIVVAVDPATIIKMININVMQGSLAEVAGPNTVAVDSDTATRDGLNLGGTVAMTTAAGKKDLVVKAFYKAQGQFSGFVVARSTFPAATEDISVYATLSPGSDPAAVKKAAATVLSSYPTVTVQDQTEFKASIRNQINQLLALVTGLLALSLLVAVIGIVNTLALSVVERTREIGLLRAVGLTRRQTRRMVRFEAVLISAFGGILGVVLGVVIGVALQQSLVDSGITVLSIPVRLLVTFLVVAAVVGVLAALWPAWRAGKLDVLRAISTS